MLALPVRQIFPLVDEAECHRGENESDVEQHDRIIDPLNRCGISSVVEMLLERACSVSYPLGRRRRFREIGACCLLIRDCLSERNAVGAYARPP